MQKLHTRTNTFTELAEAFVSLYEKTTDKNTPIRRIGISLNRLEQASLKQLSLFEDNTLNQKEEKLERAMVFVKSKMGPNAILKGMNLEEGATAIDRNEQISGHKA